ncbi:unnamed protein product [Bursaphelenchus okinawaensis]|uniref:Exonuclease domain-containing protein n=1 Tax=Bursaphelenchus okinawaensis TaxID=465554 RepID=A0A811K2E5_9BILA|nr:unnamed protein product [Bursaphelenchus okinawaensis]CAG9089776.1 unnamed protein product [Bursaphelenchus okinawaensis]
MIPISSVFSHLPCADGYKCNRPYCRYNHNDDISTPRSPEPVEDVQRSPTFADLFDDVTPEIPVVIQQESYDDFDYNGYYAHDDPQYAGYSASGSMYNPEDPLGKKEANAKKAAKVKPQEKKIEYSMLDKPALPADLGEDDILMNLHPEANKPKTKKDKPNNGQKLKSAPKLARPTEPIKLPNLPEPSVTPSEPLKRKNSKELEDSSKKRKITQEELEELEKKAKLFDMYMNNMHKVSDIDAQIKEIEQRRNQLKNDPSFVDSLFEGEPLKTLEEDVPSTSTSTVNKVPIITANSLGSRITNGKITARTQMLNRLDAAQKANLAKRNEPVNISLMLAAEKRAVNSKPSTSTANNNRSTGIAGRVTKPTFGANRTSSSTVAKGETRKAHTGTCGDLLPLDKDSPKIPFGFRTKYLKMLFCEFDKKKLPAQTCVKMAQREEKAILDKASTQSGYTSLMVGAVRSIRKETVDLQKGTVTESRAQKTVDKLSESTFYRLLRQKYLMTDELLKSNGYPCVVKVDGKPTVEIQSWDQKKIMFIEDHVLKRTCSRCGAEYELKKDGSFVKPSDCEFHWKRAYKVRVNKTLESRYQCCGGDLTLKGCTIQKGHVHDTMRRSVLRQFCRTPPPVDNNDPRSTKVYAMDCEMVFTTWGMSVARLTVVDFNDELVLDIIIKPKEKVLDYNTKFSGLTEEMLQTATHDLEAARKKLFEIINSETVLIGHSLESDLRALRLVHRKVVDTAIIFPHRLGPPYKRALKTLASDYLNKIIQEDAAGHCSKEDSSACMQLMLLKVKRECTAELEEVALKEGK